VADAPSRDTIDLLLLVATTEWNRAEMSRPSSDVYKILADDGVVLATGQGLEDMRFHLAGSTLTTIAAQIPIGLVGAALRTHSLLSSYQPRIVVQIGFGGILSKDLRIEDIAIGDIAVASQVDCYLTKGRAEAGQAGQSDALPTEVTFAGECFRTTFGLVQSAINLKHAFPQIYAKYQSDVRGSQHLRRILDQPNHPVREYLRIDGSATGPEISLVHAVHFASAELVSTSKKAVKWLLARDRKLGMVDMESGGVMQAVAEHQHRSGRPIDVLILRGAGGFGDERHAIIRASPDETQSLAFENAARFVAALFQGHGVQQTVLREAVAIDVGIIIPMEEEFGYFSELMKSEQIDLSASAKTYQGRIYYFFERAGTRCAATFVGDMGLVRMALATEDLRRAFTPSVIVVIGIAAGFEGPSGNARVCDVVVASSVDLYLHRARLHYGGKTHEGSQPSFGFAELKDQFVLPTTAALAAFAVTDVRFAERRSDWAAACERELSALPSRAREASVNIEGLRIAVRPSIREVRLASGELLSGATELVKKLKERGCGATDMEAGGAVIACNQSAGGPVPHLMILRGISDSGNEQKPILEKLGGRNFFRRACMRNASRLLLSMIDHPEFIAMIARPFDQQQL
jgi:nucleoside phosphorylase